MTAYIVRRLFYGIAVLIGVNLLTFVPVSYTHLTLPTIYSV